jgi:tetratricopeptide (TPR) repeat protein
METNRLYGEQRDNMIKQHLQSIESGDLEAIVNLANYYNYIENDNEMTIKYYQMGIEKNSEICYCNLGDYYNKIKKNDLAIEIWNTGIENIGSTICMLKLAIYYKDNLFYDEAIKYYTMCFDYGNLIGMWQLGLFYQFVIKDYDKMKESFIKAIKNGDHNSAYCIGLYYKEKLNYDVMKKYFLLAIKKNHNLAIFDLAQHYEDVENNIPMAMKYYFKGFEIGDKKCIEAWKKYICNNNSLSIEN